MERPDEDIEDDQMIAEDCIINTLEEDLKSPKIPEYSHLPPDPMDADRSEGKSTTRQSVVITLKSNFVGNSADTY